MVRFILCFLLTASGAWSRDLRPQVSPKIYQHPTTETIYIHPAMPVSIWMQGPNVEDRYKLNTNQPKASDSIHMQTHGFHTALIQDGERKFTFPFFVDSKAPKIIISRNKTAHQVLDRPYFDQELEINFEGQDDDSGLAGIYYRLDKGAFLPYQSPLNSFKEGHHQLDYYGVDNVGNLSPLYTDKFYIDQTPPRSQINYINMTNKDKTIIVSPETIITLQAIDKGSGTARIVYRLQRNGESVRSGDYTNKPIRIKGLEAGTYELKVFAVDHVENRESEHVHTLIVDKSGPEYTTEVLGPKFIQEGTTYISGKSTIKVSGSDLTNGLSSLLTRYNNSEYTLYKSPMSPPPAHGPFTLEVRGRDLVGNESFQSFPKLFFDSQNPVVSYQFQGPLYTIANISYVSPQTQFHLESSDQGSGVKQISYRVQQSKESVIYTGPLRFKKEGPIQISVHSMDNVGNKATAKAINVINDARPPEIFVRFSNEPIQVSKDGDPIKVYPTNTKIFVSATDAHSGIDEISYQINGRNITILKEAWIVLDQQGSYDIEITATDRVSNKATTHIKLLIKNPEILAH